MRIVAGSLRGRQLAAPAGETTRPTSDRVREALGSVLQARGAWLGACVLDLFAGSGALGLEALSRGARRCVFVERDAGALRCLRDNVQALGVEDRARIVSLDLLGGAAAVTTQLSQWETERFDLVLCDPPYALVAEAAGLLGALCAHGLLSPQALLVLEHDRKRPPPLPSGLAALAQYNYGDTGVALWETVAPVTES